MHVTDRRNRQRLSPAAARSQKVDVQLRQRRRLDRLQTHSANVRYHVATQVVPVAGPGLGFDRGRMTCEPFLEISLDRCPTLVDVLHASRSNPSRVPGGFGRGLSGETANPFWSADSGG